MDSDNWKQKFLGDRNLPLEERLQYNQFFNKNVTVIQNNEEKMSDVLLKFGSALIKGNENVQELDKIVGFLMMTWNISSISPLDERKNAIRSLVALYLNDFGKGLVGTETIIESLFKKREKEFSHIKKLIVDYDINFKNGQPSLKVISAPMTKDS